MSTLDAATQLFLFFLKSTTYLKWGVCLMIHSKLKGSLIHFHLFYNVVYIDLNTFFPGGSDRLSIGSLPVGSRQVGSECSSSTASIRQPIRTRFPVLAWRAA